MNESIPLGKIAGIRVGLNWSLLVVFVLISWGLAGDTFPIAYAGYSIGAYWTAGLATAVVFFASLIAHEMGHALVARRDGVLVEGITLWLFGGVAKLRGDATSARSELRIALAGPVVSVALAGAYALLNAAFAATSSDLIAGVFYWLARINLVLAAFNMVPAFPLDGGRVFRAWLWRKRGRERATQVAALVGQGFGFLLIAVGVIESAMRSDLGGLWFVFLGYFLVTAARNEAFHVTTRAAFEGMTARDIMRPDPLVAPQWLTVEAFVDNYALVDRGRAWPLGNIHGTLVGLVTLTKLEKVPQSQRRTLRISALAVPIESVPLARSDERLTSLLDRVGASSEGCALVLEDGALVGMITPDEINRAMQILRLREGTAPAGRPAPEIR